MVAKLRQIKAELRRRMHDPVSSVGEWLKRVTLGYYNYYAVPGNIDRLNVFAQRLRRLWRLILCRRSQRGRMLWDRLTPIFQRLDSSTPRFASLSLRTLCRHPSKVGAVCVNALVRFCAGGDQ